MSKLRKSNKKQPVPANSENEIKEKFKKKLIIDNAFATSNFRATTFDIDKATQKSNDAMVSMDANSGLQTMLAAQMISIHELQQKTMACANTTDNLELQKYYTNSAIKLANCFTQQANTLAKLQGIGGQKMIVERVDVHQGGQAVVGTIQGSMGNKEKR